MSSITIGLLRKTFSSLGLPEVLVSDNATAFTSAEFSEFLQKMESVTFGPLRTGIEWSGGKGSSVLQRGHETHPDP